MQYYIKVVESSREWNKCIDIFLDLAKTFDTIHHNRLDYKLENIGIKRSIQTCLAGRKQRAKIGQTISDFLQLWGTAGNCFRSYVVSYIH